MADIDNAAQADIETVNPTTEEPLERFAVHGEADIAAVLGRARAAFAVWRHTPPAQRALVLNEIARLLRAELPRLARQAVIEMGKPLPQAEAEVEKCAWTAEWLAREAPALLADRPVATEARASYVAFDALGPLLAIMPWNFPYWQVLRAALPALAAGNVVLLKHAPNVTRAALELEALVRRAGGPEGLLQALVIPVERVAALIADERVAAVTLTGSDRAGAQVAAQAGAALKKTVLELGGSDAFIVLADADVEAAAATAVRARFQNNGQSCIAAKRFILEAPIARAFTDAFVAAAERLRVGDPLMRGTDLGPLARADLRDNLDRQVRASVAAGARLLTGGRPLERRGWFYAATVLADVPPDAPALREETFGPVAALVTVRDAAAAVALANDSRFGLGGNLWTRDLERAAVLARQLESGAVFINGMTASDARLPFGGVKRSGYGRELGSFGLHEFINIKTVWVGPATVAAAPTAPAE